jgi:hypothetical protein
LGCSSSTTRCQAVARSESLSTGLSRSPRSPEPAVDDVRVRRPDVRFLPQVCPHLVNVTASLWKRPAETFTVGRQKPDHRRSEALRGSGHIDCDDPGTLVRPERGETRRGSNITPGRGAEQDAIHRLSGPDGTCGPGAVARSISTAGGVSAHPAGRDLTPGRRRAYRSSVTRCRRVPHVHAPPGPVPGPLDRRVGGRCRPKPRSLTEPRPALSVANGRSGRRRRDRP